MPTFASTGGLPTACRKSPSFIQLVCMLAAGRLPLACLQMETQLAQLASQIRAELQAVRDLERQIDPEDVDDLQAGALLVACVVCAVLCIHQACALLDADSRQP